MASSIEFVHGRGALLQRFGAHRGDTRIVLSRVDQVEIQGEGAGDSPRGLGMQAGDLRRQGALPCGGLERIVRAAGFGGRADVLLQVEQGLRFLLDQHLAQQIPHEVDGFGNIHLK